MKGTERFNWRHAALRAGPVVAIVFAVAFLVPMIIRVRRGEGLVPYDSLSGALYPLTAVITALVFLLVLAVGGLLHWWSGKHGGRSGGGER